jgi:CubicO group peptidase (beta-lactamase class C family)
MPAAPRSLPDHPDLRYLKLEAKRRHAAGEFPSLHDAQTAIAREHGLPSWAALKQRVTAELDSHALIQLRWVMSRFAGAGEPGWTAPGDDELRQHFAQSFLSALPPAALVPAISRMATVLRGGQLVVRRQSPVQANVELNGMQYIVAVEAEPPHRLTGLRGLPNGSRVRDPRIANSPVASTGEVPQQVPAIAAEAVAELGLTGLTVAGAGRDAASPWVLATGWASLDSGEPLAPGHRFAAPGVTMLVTATAVLRLVADGRIGLDSRANDHLHAVRLADDTITVRELLSHTAGVDNPGPRDMYADTVPELSELMGPVIACPGPRGVPQPSNGGCAVLGQLVADLTGLPYAAAATQLVLDPLHLRDSVFPGRPADIGPGAVSGYHLTLEGVFQPVPARIPALQAAAGLWSTGADLVRLGLRWSALLPRSLAHEALTPQSGPGPGGGQTGLGWIISPSGDAAMHAGAGLEATAVLTVRLSDQHTHVVLTSRLMPVADLADRLLSSFPSAPAS